MGTTFGLHHISLPPPGLNPPTGVKFELQPNPYFWGWGVQICWNFSNLTKKLNFCLLGLRKNLVTKGGNDKFFIGKITHVFGDTVGNPFLKEFSILRKKIRKKIWLGTTGGGNVGTREQLE
jgi:hypothetical protein